MVYRFHFTGADLARTRVAESVPPLEELSIALRVLQDRNQAVRFGAWRREVWSRLPPQARMVLDLTPRHGWVPAFLNPQGTGSVPELLERVAATPAGRIRASLAQIAERQRMPGWASLLGDSPEVLRHSSTPSARSTRSSWPRTGPRSPPRSRPTGPSGPMSSCTGVSSGC